LVVDDHEDNYHGYEAWYISVEYTDSNQTPLNINPGFAKGWYAYDGDALFRFIGDQWVKILSEDMNEGDDALYGMFIEHEAYCTGKRKSENWGETIGLQAQVFYSHMSESYAAYIGPLGYYSYSDDYGSGYAHNDANLIDYNVQ
jgi:hypothetical protein